MTRSFWIVFLTLALLLAALIPGVAAQTTYTVQPGDSIARIASRFGVDDWSLAAANDLEEPYTIQPGQILVIPGHGVQEVVPDPVAEPDVVKEPEATASPISSAPSVSTAPGTYSVKAGDSVFKIAEQFGTNHLVLIALNDLEEPYVLSIGQVLKVPGAPAVAAESAPVAAAVVENTAPAVPQTAVTAPPPAPPAVAVAPIATGDFAFGGQTQSFANRQLMQEIGMNWVKFQHKWSPGDSPEAVAGRIADAHNSGFKVLLSIPGATTYPGPGGIDYASYVEFLRGVAALGPDAIEVWNEMNIDFEWPAGEIDPSSYVNNMLAPAYNAIKSANPNVLVVGGALAPTGFDNGVNAWADSRYLAGMAAAGAARYMDCTGAHHNAGATPSATSGHPGGNHYSWYFKPTLDLYYNSFGGATKVCFTELGYVSPNGFPGISPQFGWAADNTVTEHAQWLADAVRLAQSSGKARMAIVFNVDFTNYDPNGDPQAGYAIVRPDGGCPACDAFGRK